MEYQFLLIAIVAGIVYMLDRWMFNIKRNRRRSYYRNVYLKSGAWKRKR